MRIVGIVAEYNPFHNGHLYQIESIRRELGEDTLIVAVMSGNFTQRGEIAITNKVTRAKCAVLSGVDLVLELPFPFCSGCAEIFALSAVSILHEIGVVDVLSFGSECGDIDELERTAARLLSPTFVRAREIEIAAHPQIGHAAITEKTYRKLYGEDAAFTPNNILAFEYLGALSRLGSTIVPHTVKRCGASYTSEVLACELSSATAIRRAIRNADERAYTQLPNSVADVLRAAVQRGELPAEEDKLYPAIAAKLMETDGVVSDGDPADGSDGLYNRLQAKCLRANNLISIIEQTETKRYTRARIRRVLLYALLGVTSSELWQLPRYTQLLGATKRGLSILKQIKDRTDFPVLTKPSDTEKLPPDAREQHRLCTAADRMYALTLPMPVAPYGALAYRPYIQK